MLGLRTVLVVDDDGFVCDHIKELLEANSYAVRTAPDGDAALGLLDAGPADIVLIDIMMPRKEGLETIIEIKRRFPQTVVVAMSASGNRGGHDFLATAAKFGADGVIKKPFSSKDLLSLLASSSVKSAATAPISTLGYDGKK